MKVIISIILILIGALSLGYYVFVYQKQTPTNVDYVWQYSQQSVVYYLETIKYDFRLTPETIVISDGAGQKVTFNRPATGQLPSSAVQTMTQWSHAGAQAQETLLTPPSDCRYLQITVKYPYEKGTTLDSAIELFNCVNVLPDTANLDNFRSLS